MNKPKVALMTFGDARKHEWKNLFKGLTEPRHQRIIEYFKELPIELYSHPEVARSKDEIDAQVDQLKAKGATVFLVHIPCWTSPNLVVRGVQRMGLPTLLVSNRDSGTHGTVGLLGAAGALDQIGYPHLRVREGFETPKLGEKALPFIRAASAVSQLKGQVFGMFGGRSLGIDTGSIDDMQWRKKFGIDVEHIDQLEIIRRAEMIETEDADKTVSWLEDTVASVQYDDVKLTPDKLGFQTRCYLATRDIINELSLDFVAVKCMPDLTNHYVPQCISAALLPSPFDAEGERKPIPMACEADGDGALTMQVLGLVSGGAPTLFGDLSYLDEENATIYVPNCGAMCSWFAGRSEKPEENMQKIELRPSFRPGGGATVYFKAAPGPVTMARLSRRSGKYVMTIFSGEAIEPSPKAYENFVKSRGSHQLPTMFVHADLDFEALINEFGSNHISGVAGDYVEELIHVCKLLDIVPVVLAS
ncbi:MAG: L-fucose/L-arabinose isomerase family protein [Anaerolineae bacterium]|jgi:L-fucose/D-arabinose isomerase|nr:L-fucose/L-arabinose isomerase family protein [Anaerolineae bacterium]